MQPSCASSACDNGDFLAAVSFRTFRAMVFTMLPPFNRLRQNIVLQADAA